MINTSKKIKVLHIITRLDVGGSSTNTIETVARLDWNQFDPVLISGLTVDPDGMIESGLKARKIKYHFLNNLVRNINPWKDFLVFFQLCRIIHREKCDIVHTHSSKAGIVGRWAAKCAGVPVIIHTPHGHVFYGYFNQIVTRIFIVIERLTALVTNRIITLTERGRQEHVAFGIASKDKFIAIPSGIDIDTKRMDEQSRAVLRKNLKIPDNQFIFGTIARLDPIKGIIFLIEAAAIVKKEHHNVCLIVVGDGSQKELLKKKSEDLGLSDCVFFTGHQNETKPFIEIMDVFVLPSINEGMGRVILDAMVHAKPVVASEVGGIPDVVDDCKTGLLVAPKDSQALARAMISMIRDPQGAKNMGLKGFKKVTNQYSLNQMVARIAALYMELLHRR